MAIIKTASKSGYSAEYLRLTRIDHFDELVREAKFIFSLFKDKTTSDAGVEPLVAVAAVLSLKGDTFVTYFGPSATGASNIKRQAYRAAKAEGLRGFDGQWDLKDAEDDLS